MMVFYNEIDPFAAAWLRELIKAGVIAPGVVDERSIEDILPDELMGYTQCHFFAGIGVWSYALRCAGWPDDRPVWTGSCPCQPFSAAGKRGGTADERHLWPAFYHLISQCRPVTVFGEQVASADGRAWIDTVQSDMEAVGYTFGPVDICAAGLGAPHIRQRLWFVADSEGDGRKWEFTGQCKIERKREDGSGQRTGFWDAIECASSEPCFVADTERYGRDERRAEREGQFGTSAPVNGGAVGDVADTKSVRRSGGVRSARDEDEKYGTNHAPITGNGPTNGFWADAEWLPCRDGKARPVEPGTFPLVDGAPANMVRVRDSGEEIDANNTPEARVMRLRGYGNAIVAPVAEAWIRAYMEEMAGAKNGKIADH